MKQKYRVWLFFGEGTIYNAQKLVSDKAYTSRKIGTGDLGSRRLAWETVFGSSFLLKGYLGP